MQDALRSTPMDDDQTAGRSSAGLKKVLAAGVATVGAGAMAITPMAPTVAAEAAREAQERAVALTAAADPVEEAQGALSETLLNLGFLGSNTITAYAAVAAAFQAADLPGELSTILLANLSNPAPLLERLASFGDVYGDDLQIAFFGREDDPTTVDNPATPQVENNENYDGVFERFSLVGTEFQALLADLQVYDPPANDPDQGPITNMAFEINNFFVFGALDNLRPLIGATPAGIVPLFSIPGDFLGGEVAGGFEGGLPGFVPGVDDPSTPNVNEDLSTGTRIDNLINVLNEQTFVRAAVGPFQTAFFQAAQILDDVTAAYEAGDTELAQNELANLPVRVLNAAINGFAPSFSPGGAEWPSFLDPAQQQSGLGKYLAVDLPNQLLDALGSPRYVPQVPAVPAPAPTARVASTDVSAPAAQSFSFAPSEVVSYTEDEGATDEDLLVEEEVIEEESAAVEEDETESKPAGSYRPGRIISSIANRWADRLGLNSDDDESDEAAADTDDDDADADSDDDSDDSDNGSDDSGSEGGSED